jgi:ketosteroid isomerase-like protein
MRRRLAGLSLVWLSATQCRSSAGVISTSHRAALQDSVRAALADFGRYAAAAQWESMAGLYSDDPGFYWIEDGRRVGKAGVRQALLAVPAGMKVETTYDSTNIVVRGPGLADLSTYYRSRFVGSSPPIAFSGAISMVWAHEPGGWRIESGHSSSARAPR